MALRVNEASRMVGLAASGGGPGSTLVRPLDSGRAGRRSAARDVSRPDGALCEGVDATGPGGYAVVADGAKDARDVVHRLAGRFILGGVSLGRLYPGQTALAGGLLVTATETNTSEDIEAFAAALEGILA